MKATSRMGMLLAVHLLTTSATWLEADPFENWVQRLPDMRALEDVTFGKDAFVAVGWNGWIYSSKNGVDWAFRGVNTAYSFYGVTYGGGQFLAVGTFAIHLDALTCIGLSTDGQNWGILWDEWHPNETFVSVTYGNDAAVAINWDYDHLFCATNLQGAGPYWTLVGTGSLGSFTRVTFGGGRFVLVGEGGLIQTSFNGKDWVVANSGVTNALLDVAYGNGTYMAVGLEGTILRSGDGITWMPCASPTTNGLSCIAFGAGVFLAGGYPVSEVFSSTGGAVWQLHRTNIPNPPDGLDRWLQPLTFGAGSFVAIVWKYAPGCCIWSSSICQSGSVQVELSGAYRADLNGFEVTARGGLERAYRLQESTNLTDWTNVLVFTNSGPTNIFLDTSASQTPRRFFRAVAP